MFAAVAADVSYQVVTAGASHPAVAAWLGLGTAGLAGVVVAMAWSVNTRQIRLAEQLARRQLLVTADTGAASRTPDEGSPAGEVEGAPGARQGAGRARQVPPPVIEGPDHVVAGEQARYRVRPSGTPQTVSWAVGGGSVTQSPDPSHPDELLLIADQPGELTITVRVREGLTERREVKSVTVAPDVTAATTPFALRLFLQGWGLVVVAVLIVGFAAALDALGNFTSSDFIALAVPLAALLGVIAVARGSSDPDGRPGHGKRHGHV
jgi:hypothetical protein